MADLPTQGIVLAPMEGVTDATMRALLTRSGHFDRCFTEFVRVSSHVVPDHVIRRYAPETSSQSTTESGTPLSIQLLGGDPELLAETARAACALGARGIDLNFGCPAPTVNRHDGGATLLKFPERIEAIVSAVRAAVPAEFPMSVKVRLGFASRSALAENARRAARGGATWLTVHARTREQGYAPPAHWQDLATLHEEIAIPVIANGDLWTVADLERCAEASGCRQFMLARGALADPDLPRRARLWLDGRLQPRSEDDVSPFLQSAKAWVPLLDTYMQEMMARSPEARRSLQRVKQWLRISHMRFQHRWFDTVKRATTYEELRAQMEEL